MRAANFLAILLLFLIANFCRATVPAGVDITTWPLDMLIVDASGTHDTLPDPAAQAELARRPNAAEHILTELEHALAANTTAWRHHTYLGAMIRFSNPTHSQLDRAFVLVKEAYHKEKAAGSAAELPEGERLLFNSAPIVFTAVKSPEAEQMLLDLLRRPEVRGPEAVLENIAQKPTPDRILAMKRRLEGMRELHPEYVPGHHIYISLLKAIETAERNLANPPPRVTPGERNQISSIPPALTQTGRLNGPRESDAPSFWREPFVWITAVLLLGAGGVWLVRRRT